MISRGEGKAASEKRKSRLEMILNQHHRYVKKLQKRLTSLTVVHKSLSLLKKQVRAVGLLRRNLVLKVVRLKRQRVT